ncbi:MAG: hypothetical protein WEA04_01590 [Candidatus Andersenbacteria bacterium]
MTLKAFFKREKYVALHAQSFRFRIVKYLVIFGIAYAVYAWKGLESLGLLFLFLTVVALGIHFLFRWKTQAWTKSWGPYTYIPLPPDEQ